MEFDLTDEQRLIQDTVRDFVDERVLPNAIENDIAHRLDMSAIEGMAGVGKTQLAMHAGHMLARERPFQQVLFVNLRGFHPDPAQPPAEPAAVHGYAPDTWGPPAADRLIDPRRWHLGGRG